MILWLTLLGSSFLWAQQISNVRVEQDPELRYYKITFDLSGNNDEEYFVQVLPQKDGIELSSLSYLIGDGIGRFIKPGKNHRIFW